MRSQLVNLLKQNFRVISKIEGRFAGTMDQLTDEEEDKLAIQKGGRMVNVLDENQRGMRLVQYEDLLIGTYFIKHFDPATQLQAMKQFPHRKDDVIVCSYPKSGSHWMINLLTMLQAPSSVHVTKSIDIPILEATPLHMYKKRPSPRVLHSHLRAERLPTEHVTVGGKIVLTVRNPKDVAVSLFHHLNKDLLFESKLSWNGFLQHFMNGNVLMGSYFDYLRSWDHVIRTDNNINVLVVHFENLTKKPVEEARRLQRFLDLQLSDARLQETLDRCSLEKLKDDVVSRRTRTSMFDKNKQQIIFRKGIIGDWMNHLTVAQSDSMDKLIQDKLSDTMFRFDYYPSTPKQRL